MLRVCFQHNILPNTLCFKSKHLASSQGRYVYQLDPPIEGIASFPVKSKFEGGVVKWQAQDADENKMVQETALSYALKQVELLTIRVVATFLSLSRLCR